MFRLNAGPGGVPLAGAGFLPMIQPISAALSLQDSATGTRSADSTQLLQLHPADSLVDKRLFGDRITTVIQFLFQQSPWVMWGGVLLAAVILFFILRWLWPRRQEVLTWFRTRSREVKFAMFAGVGVLVLLALGVGYAGYHFVETDKRFCNGCHIFVPSGQIWLQPDTGSYTMVPRMEGKHDSLSCHTCHPLNPKKEAVKLVFWMSGLRQEKIPEHARVPRKICEQCHVQGAAKETWQAIAATAGHRTHLESDSSSLKGKVECLTCHARTAHRFPPINQTCGQQGCHETDKTKIVLGKMASQGDFHCTACHIFTATVPLLATRDSAAGTLRPALRQCFKCHAMRERLPDFDDAKDPHRGTCGMCHDPHRQKTPAEAKTTCTSAKCHADWRKESFHVGVQHRRSGEKCLTCHAPHAARVDASDCAGCHEAIRARTGGVLRPPLPFDTLKALKSSLAPASPTVEPERPSKVKGDAPPGDGWPGQALNALRPLPSDTFPHPRHKKLACLTCHLSKTGAKLTFEPPRGCQICHHENPTKSDCSRCHEQGSLPEIVAVPVSIAAARKPPRERTVAFRHEVHDTLACTACHGTAVTMAPVDSAATCQGCHDKHHEAARHCAECHQTASITQTHAKPARVHVACDACHATAAIAPLVPTRTFCLACHDSAVDHYPTKQCSLCHLRAPPEDYRPRLLKRGSTG